MRRCRFVLGITFAAGVAACGPRGLSPDGSSKPRPAPPSRSRPARSPIGAAHAVRLELERPTPVDALLLKLQERSMPTGSTLEIYDQRPSSTPGLTNVRVRHLHQGVEVVGDEVLLGVRDGLVVTAIARLAPELPSVATSRTIVDAVAEVQTHASALGSNAIAKCALVFARPPARPTDSPALRFRCHVRVDAPRAYYEVVLDAATLARVYIHNTALEAFVPATAHGDTAYDLPNVTFDAQMDDVTGEYQMFSDRLRTWDNQGDTDFGTSVPIRSNTDLFDGLIASLGVSVQWGAERAFETHLSRFGFDTVDRMRLRTGRAEFDQVVNFGGNDAFFNAEEARTTYGGLDGEYYTHIDVVGHEYGHAAVFYSLPPDALALSVDHTEYGAIMESIADIFGELTEKDAMPTNDWIVGGPLPPTIQERNLLDPLLSRPPQPDVYLHGNWIDPASTVDRGGVHINDSIGNLWFMRMAFGSPLTQNSRGTSFEVGSIGIEPASKIVLKSVVEKLALLGTYPSLRIASEVAIEEMCGSFSGEAQTSRDAWNAVEVPTTTPAVSETFSPQDGATDVPPWPARLAWEAKGETAWQLHLSTSASFTSPQSYLVTSVDVENGVSSGYHDVALEPDTEYFWRVRRILRDPDLQCWRKARRLKTAANVPQALLPRGGEHHPWALAFEYSAVPGATHYEIDVMKQGRAGSIFSKPQLVPTDVRSGPNRGSRATGEITVLKTEKLEWRVRAVYAPTVGPRFVSDWSALLEFFTSDPQPTTNNPIHNSIQYPWNLEYDWNELRGAEQYDGRILRLGSNALADKFTVVAPHLQTLRSWSADLESKHHWQLKAKGPPLGHASSPEADDTAEESLWSTDKTYELDFAATRVHITYPNWDPVVRGCYDVDGAPPQIEFNPIPHASEIVFEYVLLRDHNSGANPPSLHAGFPHVLETVTIPGTQAQGSGGPTNFRGLGEGYAVRARARGPNRVWGAVPEPADFGEYGLTPPKPNVLNPDLFPGWNPGWVHMLWETIYAPRGMFRVEIFANGNCSGAPDSTHVIKMNSAGGSAYQVDKGFGLFSYRVRPAFDLVCSKTSLQWSACQAQNIEPPPPPPPPSGIVVYYENVRILSWFFVSTGKLYMLFTPVEGANVYRAEVRIIGTSTVWPFGFGEGALVAQKNEAKALYCTQNPDSPPCGPNPEPFFPGMLFAAATMGPFESYEVRMRSCRDSDCGDWSDWHPGI